MDARGGASTRTVLARRRKWVPKPFLDVWDYGTVVGKLKRLGGLNGAGTRMGVGPPEGLTPGINVGGPPDGGAD